MKWEGRRKSDNLEDRRGASSKGKIALGGGAATVIIILLLQLFGGETGKQIVPIIEQFTQNQTGQQVEGNRELSEKDIAIGNFVATVLADTEDVWHQIFNENNLGTYKEPRMTLFTDAVATACGTGEAAMGPFYCPADQKVYMDLIFFEELHSRFGAKAGDFTIAYVTAHEIGHHVQTLLGTSQKVRELQQRASQVDANKLSVALELQADFYAGVWANRNQKYLEAGDIELALSAASAVGDDAIQKKMQGRVNPDSFTHGSSEQRVYWFTKGFKTGDIRQGDSFSELIN